MTEQQYKVGDFQKYQVVREGVFFGFINTVSGGYSPAKNEVFEYDGSTVVLNDGQEFSGVPQLRAAIRAGWCVLAGKQVQASRPKPAGIKVRQTQTKGYEKAVKSDVTVQTSDERTIVVVSEREAQRERTNLRASQKVATPKWTSGDAEVDEIVALLDAELFPEGSVKSPPTESDFLEALDALEGPSAQAEVPKSATRGFAVENQDERPVMSVIREEDTNQGEQVVGVIEESPDMALEVAPAVPAVKADAPRPGISGALVLQEQQDKGRISLSQEATKLPLHESAKAVQSSTETVRIKEASVSQNGAQRAPETDQGVAVGRILSPTKTSFVADGVNTSPSAIQRTAEGGRAKVEKYATDQDHEEVRSADPVTAKATGDVEEARSGDNLEDLLPNAAKTPEVYKRPDEDPAYAAVKMMIPDFEWNKDLPVKDRVSNAIKHLDNPMYLKGILAVESEIGREEIKTGIAKALAKKKKPKTAKRGKKKTPKSSKRQNA